MTSVDPGAAVDFSIPSVFELGTVNSTGATVPVVDPRRVTLGTGVEVHTFYAAREKYSLRMLL